MEGNVVGMVLQRNQVESIVKELTHMLNDPEVKSIVISIDDNEFPSKNREMMTIKDGVSVPKIDALLAGEAYTLGISTSDPYDIVKLVGTSALNREVVRNSMMMQMEEKILKEGFKKCPIL